MDPRVAATPAPDAHAIEFVRFCHRRRRVGWPELYDEMCAVAARGLYHGYSAEDLGNHGIRFGLFDMPALAALTREVVAAELAARRPVQVAIHALPAEAIEGLVEAAPEVVATTVQVAVAPLGEPALAVAVAPPADHVAVDTVAVERVAVERVAVERVAVERIAVERVAVEPRPTTESAAPRFRPVPAGV